MKTKLMLAILSLVYFVNTANAQILIDSTFTYQGQLQDNGQAADHGNTGGGTNTQRQQHPTQ